MDFGSEYILQEEEVDEEEDDLAVARDPSQKEIEDDYYEDYSGFECEIMEFDDDEKPNDTSVPVKENKTNTNTVKVDLKNLLEKPDVFVKMSKFVECNNQNCGTVYSHLAEIVAEKKIWICNFCGKENDIKTELPDLSGNKNDVIYSDDIDENKFPDLKPAEESKLKVIFVIDISSSMCQTKPMDINSRKSETLKSIIEKDNEKNQQRQQQYLIAGDQPILQIQNSNQVEVSRLQAFKASVIDIIKKLQLDHPKTRVGLVTFCEYVKVFDINVSDSNIVQGGQLGDMAELQRIGERHSELCSVEESADKMIAYIESLEETGRTALGPALIIAQNMAKLAPGSKIILCTDGVANIGLGRLEETTPKDIDSFYNEVIACSRVLGVSISVICVDKAGLNTRFGEVPTGTGGILEMVDDKEVEDKIAFELFKQERATVALNADITFTVHKDLYVKNSLKPNQKERESQYLHKIGNMQLDNKFVFNFMFKPGSSQNQTPTVPQTSETTAESTATEIQKLPFQVMVSYWNLSDVRVVRVWTTERQITKNRAQAEEAANPKTVVENFLQSSANELLNLKTEYGLKKRQANAFTHKSKDLPKTMDLDKATLDKLIRFAVLMEKIVKNDGDIADDVLAELTKLKDSRGGQVQG